MPPFGPQHDVVIVGGGIVGLATALALSASGRHKITILEAESRLAAHQTGHNSGVIHAGLYYRPGSLKARLCADGRAALARFCTEESVPFDICGKLVVATRPEELAALSELERRGAANGLTGLRRLGPEEIADFEPHASGLAALHVPQTGIVDYGEVAVAMARVAKRQGVALHTGARLIGCTRSDGGVVLETSAGSFRTRTMVACAGLQADRVARSCGVEPGIRLVPFRGRYHALVPECRQLVRNLIYPVPDPRFPFLGVHFTRTIHGLVEAGPNAVLALARHGYSRASFSAADAWDALAYRGTLQLARRYGRTAVAEVWQDVWEPALVRALQRLVPDVGAADLVPAGAGIRAQAVMPSGDLIDDFHIVEAPGMVHVLNAPSPAATASLAIGQHIARLAESQLA